MTGLNPASDSMPATVRGMRVSSTVLVVGGVAVAFTVIYLALSLYQPVPIIFPDEFIYGHLARSLANGGGFTWRGQAEPLRAAGYVFAIAPAWLFSSGVNAYHIAKIESVIFCCLTALPVWYLAREVLERRLAIAAVVLSLSGTWMVATAGLLTENAALPLATAALCMAVLAMRHPERRFAWWSLGFALAAVLFRMQLVVLLPALALAFVFDALRDPAHWRARLSPYLIPLTVLGALVFLGAVVAIADGHAVTGIYSDVLHYHPSLGRIVGKSALQLGQLTAMSGFLPLLLIAVIAFRRAAWKDETVGPLLAVFVPAALALVVESGFFLASNAPWGIERYVIYVVPLALILALAVFSEPRLSGRVSLLIALGLSLLFLLLPQLGNATEERAVAATFVRVRAITGTDSVATAVTIGAIVAGLAIGGALLVGRSRNGRRAGALVAAAALLLVLVVQSASAWSLQLNLSRDWRSAFPSDLQWVDHHAKAPVAVLAVTANALGFEDLDFFNSHVTQFYRPPSGLPGRAVLGRVCQWAVRSDGRLALDHACGPTPHEFFVNDPAAALTFRREGPVTSDPHAGQLISVRGTPQLLGLIATPCNRPRVRFIAPLERHVAATAPSACAPVLISDLWLPAPATLRVTFRGGAADHRVAYGSHVYPVPAGRSTTISVPVKPGASTEQFQLDWARRSPTEPSFVGARLDSGGQSTKLY